MTSSQSGPVMPAMYWSGESPEQQGDPAEHGSDPADPAGGRTVPQGRDGHGDAGDARADPQPRDGPDPVAEEDRGLRDELVLGLAHAEDELGREARSHQLGHGHEPEPRRGDVGQQAARGQLAGQPAAQPGGEDHEQGQAEHGRRVEGEDGAGLLREASDDRGRVARDVRRVDGVDLHRGPDRDEPGQPGAHARPGPEPA